MQPEIVFEDKEVLVVYKPEGMAVETAKITEQDLFSWVKGYLQRANKKESYVGMIHRIDQPVEGLLVFAKTKRSAQILSRQVQDKVMKKGYLAVICMDGDQSNQDKRTLDYVEFVDYLIKDGKTNTSKAVSASDKHAKKAKLFYRIIDLYEPKEEFKYHETFNDSEPLISDKNGMARKSSLLALIEIKLETGRHHQIRVQMSSHNMPLLGDVKYGSERSQIAGRENNVRQVALCAYKLSFAHPTTNEQMDFEIKPRKLIFGKFNNKL